MQHQLYGIDPQELMDCIPAGSNQSAGKRLGIYHTLDKNKLSHPDGRQPISEVLAKKMVQELVDSGVDKNATIAVVDYACLLVVHLKQAGFININYIEDIPESLNNSDEMYYNLVTGLCSAMNVPIISLDTDMKFDVIIGNPPYSDTSSDSTCSSNLDSVFLLDAMQRAPHVSFLMRVKHFADERSTFRRKVLGCARVKSITYVNPRIFNIDDRIAVCNIVIGKDTVDSTRITYKSGEQRDVVLSPDAVIFIDNPDKQKVEHSLASRWVRGKSNRNQLTESQDGFPIVVVGGSGESPVMMNTSTGEPTAANSWGVVTNTINTIGTLGRVFLKPYDAAISASVTAFLTDTEEEAIALLEYLTSDEGREAIRAAKTTPCISQSSLRYVADPLIA